METSSKYEIPFACNEHEFLLFKKKKFKTAFKLLHSVFFDRIRDVHNKLTISNVGRLNFVMLQSGLNAVEFEFNW